MDQLQEKMYVVQKMNVIPWTPLGTLQLAQYQAQDVKSVWILHFVYTQGKKTFKKP